MIDLFTQTLHVPGFTAEPIKRWAVYFITVEGSFDTIEAAVESCERTGSTAIVPVPVAIGETTYEVVLHQGVTDG